MFPNLLTARSAAASGSSSPSNTSTTDSNGTSFSGMIAELEMSFQDGSTQLISTDKSWRASNLEPANWEKDPAVSASWPAAVEQYRYGTGPWGSDVIFQHVK